MIEGYNIAFKLDAGLTMAGRTQDDLTIAARTLERLTKDDEGAAQVAVVGQDVTFRCSGLIDVDGNLIDRETLMESAVTAEGDDAIWDFAYQALQGDKQITGTAVITNYSESSNAEGDATYTVDFRVVGEPEVTTYSIGGLDPSINPSNP